MGVVSGSNKDNSPWMVLRPNERERSGGSARAKGEEKRANMAEMLYL